MGPYVKILRQFQKIWHNGFQLKSHIIQLFIIVIGTLGCLWRRNWKKFRGFGWRTSQDVIDLIWLIQNKGKSVLHECHQSKLWGNAWLLYPSPEFLLFFSTFARELSGAACRPQGSMLEVVWVWSEALFLLFISQGLGISHRWIDGSRTFILMALWRFFMRYKKFQLFQKYPGAESAQRLAESLKLHSTSLRVAAIVYLGH